MSIFSECCFPVTLFCHNSATSEVLLKKKAKMNIQKSRNVLELIYKPKLTNLILDSQKLQVSNFNINKDIDSYTTLSQRPKT